MEISIVPIGTKTASVSRYVAEAVRILKDNAGIKYALTSMGTIVEAESIERLLEIAGRMHNAILGSKVKRVVTTIKIDERKDKKLTIEGKIKSVRQKIRGI
jgi:uncharacterized protein (TIGR00106 family)